MQHANEQAAAGDRAGERQPGSTPHFGVSHGDGQMPTRPLLPPVTASHWKTTDQTICAKASVSIAR